AQRRGQAEPDTRRRVRPAADGVQRDLGAPAEHRLMGAPELQAVEVEGFTRSAFILRGALAAGAAYGVGAVAPFVSSALGATASDDRNVLAFALSLEQLESAFYKAALARAGLSGQAQTFATSFGAHEDEHVATITQLLTQLGAKPA